MGLEAAVNSCKVRLASRGGESCRQAGSAGQALGRRQCGAGSPRGWLHVDREG